MNRRRYVMLALPVVVGATGSLAAASADGEQPPALAQAVTEEKAPPNQDRLLSDVDRAETLAGSSLGGVSIDLPTNVVNVYLVPGPDDTSLRATIDDVDPGVFQFYPAKQNRSTMLSLQAKITAARSSLETSQVHLTSITPNLDGTLQVGFSGDPSPLRSALDSISDGMATASIDSGDGTPLSSRAIDVAPWNAGDFIHIGTGPTTAYCTSGVPTHTASSGHRYFITAAHCWDEPTTNANNVYNGYIDANGNSHSGAAGVMGVLSLKDVSITNPGATLTNPTTDSAIVDAQTNGSSNLVFNGAWNGTSKTTILGTREDVVGAQVCNGGAYSGETCGLTIQYAGKTRCLTNGGCLFPTGEVWDTSANTSAAGEGDSGGPVYSYSGSSVYMQGMVSFGGDTTAVPCPSSNLNPPGRVCYHVLYYTEIGAILTRYGQVINTN
ncbi:MAG: hypothetical protein QOD07_1209 [Frankiaceae bacterium]|jgi:hypothetical protein|nr:hypothetical protein [Frankiaceae bacterium]